MIIIAFFVFMMITTIWNAIANMRRPGGVPAGGVRRSNSWINSAPIILGSGLGWRRLGRIVGWRRLFRRRWIVWRRRIVGELVMLVSEADKKRITATIAAAEQRTSGEIFCVIARQSDDYRLVPIAWAAALALLVPLPLLFFTVVPAKLIYLVQLIVFIAVALAAVVSADPVSHRAARQDAQSRLMPKRCVNSVRKVLQKTDQRTGVLIFASEAEHYAEIIADEGINAKVTAGGVGRRRCRIDCRYRQWPPGRWLHCRDRTMQRGAVAAFPPGAPEPQ